MTKLDEIRKRLETADLGPLVVSPARDESDYISVRDKYDFEVCWVTHEGHTEPTAELIAHAPSDLRLLLRIVERQREALDWIAVGHKGGPKTGSECQRKSRECIAEVDKLINETTENL